MRYLFAIGYNLLLAIQNHLTIIFERKTEKRSEITQLQKRELFTKRAIESNFQVLHKLAYQSRRTERGGSILYVVQSAFVTACK